jgi:hypothetical protein
MALYFTGFDPMFSFKLKAFHFKAKQGERKLPLAVYGLEGRNEVPR